MTNEAIILAGGFGTRLTSVIDIPKPMAPINNIPFLEYILNYLASFKITKIHLAVGYKHEVIVNHFGNQFKACELNYIIEDSPLGTGGAIKKTLKNVSSKEVFIINGDTFFDVNLTLMAKQHEINNPEVTLALKKLTNFDRYGAVQFNKDFKINNFSEKQFCEEGEINGGVYLLKTNLFDGLNYTDQFSMEQDYFEKYCSEKQFEGFISDGYFIDIGIPEDYEKAQKDLPKF